MDQPVTREVPVNILGVICYLVNNHRWHEELAIRSGEENISTLEGVSIYCLVFPNEFPRKELVCTYKSEP